MIKYEVRVLNDGTKHWFLNGKRHREDGPAVEYSNGRKEWYSNGERHREDGPAIERNNGTKEWYLNGMQQKPPKPVITTVFDIDSYRFIEL